MAMKKWRPPGKVRMWIMRRLGCSFPDTNHEALYDNLLAVVKQRDKAFIVCRRVASNDLLGAELRDQAIGALGPWRNPPNLAEELAQYKEGSWR